jgi:hypothetical protein
MVTPLWGYWCLTPNHSQMDPCASSLPYTHTMLTHRANTTTRCGKKARPWTNGKATLRTCSPAVSPTQLSLSRATHLPHGEEPTATTAAIPTR